MEKIFRGQNLCWGAFGTNIHCYTKQRARHGCPYPPPPSFSGRPCPSPPRPLRRAIFRSPKQKNMGEQDAPCAGHPYVYSDGSQCAGTIIAGNSADGASTKQSLGEYHRLTRVKVPGGGGGARPRPKQLLSVHPSTKASNSTATVL